MANMEDVLDRLQLLQEEVAAYKVKVVRLERKLQDSQDKIRDLEMKGETRATATTTKTCADSCESCKKEIGDLRRQVKDLKQEQLHAAESRGKVKKLQILLNSFILKRLTDLQVQPQKQSTKKDDWTDTKKQSSSISTTEDVKAKVKPRVPRGVSPHFESLRCSGMEVDHKSGILQAIYEHSLEVSQFISAQPLNASCPFFSLEIIDPGLKTTIGIGVCIARYPDKNQPGWKSGSIGYHADDGGIYIESGSSKSNVKTCSVGDVMGCKIDVDRNTVSFFRNDIKVTEWRVRFAVSMLHAIVGLHYGSAAVKLLEREPWRP